MDMESEGEIVAYDPTVGYVTKESRTPRRASGTFVPPYDRQTPRRSPRLLKKRHHVDDTSSTPLEQTEQKAAISTPVRTVLKKVVSSTSTDILQWFMRTNVKYRQLNFKNTKAVCDNKLTDYVIVTRKTMLDDECIGPHDAARLILSEDAKYRFMVYENILKEGVVSMSVTEGEISDLLAEMDDLSWVVCRGISEYGNYQSKIGYDINRVKLCCWPPNTARDIECSLWHMTGTSNQSDLCDRCVRLKWQLTARRKTHDDLTPSEKVKRQTASSDYPFKYLSPQSKKKKIENMRQVMSDISRKLSQKAQVIDRLCMTDTQGAEVTEVVHTIQNSEEGQQQLQQIYSEANQSGDGRGEILKQIWKRDVSDVDEFMKDQKSNVTRRRTNKWSAVTIRLAMAIYSRSPAAFRAVRSLGILQLPCDKTVTQFMHRHNTSCGVDEDALLLNAQRYDAYKVECEKEGMPPPLSTGVLIWDEVKVQSRVIWNSANSAIMGFAMTSDDFSALHDVYEELDKEERCQKTTYVVQFMWRDLSSNFDVIGPYFTISSTMETKFLHSLVTRTMLAFTQYGFGVKALLSDGASCNLSLMKLLCGHNDESANLNLGSRVHSVERKCFSLCAHRTRLVIHMLKNMIAALYSSRTDGTKEFRMNGVRFGWDTIEKVYQSDLYRAQHCISRRVPGLKYAHIVRDSWTRLNVLPAKIMQQPYMLSAIRELAEKYDSSSYNATAEYLEACNKMFEQGILSHRKITHHQSHVLLNIRSGFSYFQQWHQNLQETCPDVKLRSPLQKDFLAWQTWDLLQIMYGGFTGLCEEFLSLHPRHFISPIRVNGSAVESIFSCLKYISGGNLAATNYSSSLASYLTQSDDVVNPLAERGYRTEVLNIK